MRNAPGAVIVAETGALAVVEVSVCESASALRAESSISTIKLWNIPRFHRRILLSAWHGEIGSLPVLEQRLRYVGSMDVGCCIRIVVRDSE
jgi:hypothetical protein